ncbi:MAG: acetyl-CoA hydrolase/transferase family protein [Bdellovibrionales bacterium]|nr:acetyl-CoA hydrolase/transferase family protein [Bdellovibrionales bacterium]
MTSSIVKHNWVKADEAVQAIQSHQRVLIQGAAATPHRLIEAMVGQASRLRSVEILHLHTEGKAVYADPSYKDSFQITSFFMGSNLRQRFLPPHVDYLPCTLAEIPQLLRSKVLDIDVVLIHVSPPDKHGYCSLGTSVDIIPAALETAKLVIAQINPNMPRIHGDGFLHMSKIDYGVWVEDEIPEHEVASTTFEEEQIGHFVADLVEDGSTLQIGIGAIPEAVLSKLTDRRHLGIHTEMWSDGALKLIQAGAVDNSRKKVHPGKTVSAFLVGSRELYRFVHDNQSTVQLDVGYINNPINIARNPKVVAINSAVEVDLTGQICSDSIGGRIISGSGGQLDFIRGATFSEGGKPIIALTSRTKKGQTRIVSQLKLGAGVVTPRALVHFVATEFGCVDLFGKTLSQRAKALIEIAHPQDRENLSREWWNFCHGLSRKGTHG